MSDKKATKEMERTLLACIKKEMAQPRITKSARKALLAIRTPKLKPEPGT